MMGKRKVQGVEPEAFDPDERSPVTAELPGTPETAPSYPGDEDDSDDEREDENEAVPNARTDPNAISVDVEIEDHGAARERLTDDIDEDHRDEDDK